MQQYTNDPCISRAILIAFFELVLVLERERDCPLPVLVDSLLDTRTVCFSATYVLQHPVRRIYMECCLECILKLATSTLPTSAFNK